LAEFVIQREVVEFVGSFRVIATWSLTAAAAPRPSFLALFAALRIVTPAFTAATSTAATAPPRPTSPRLARLLLTDYLHRLLVYFFKLNFLHARSYIVGVCAFKLAFRAPHQLSVLE